MIWIKQKVQVDMVRKKGMLDRVEEEYNSILSNTANSSVASSASTSKRIEWPEISTFSTTQLYQVFFNCPIQNLWFTKNVTHCS